MRELKFRAWKMHNGKLRRCVFSPFNILNYAHRHPEAPVLHNQDVNDIRDFMPDADVIEQYTGLKDKNGKEIYIGDVVRKNYGDIIGKIVQNPSGEYRIAWIGIFGGESVLYDKRSLCEVIGNIHELNMDELCQKE